MVEVSAVIINSETIEVTKKPKYKEGDLKYKLGNYPFNLTK